MIYFDNAATSCPKPAAVTDAVIYAMNHFGNSGRGAHSTSLLASRSIFNTRQKVSDFFGGFGAAQTVFTLNATDSLNIVISGSISRSDHVVTTVYEHNSVLRPLYRTGCELSVIGLTAQNELDYGALEQSIRPDTKAVITTHASNVTGDVVDIARVAALCRKHGTLYIVDASQSAGVLPIDAKGMGIDALCLSGHKGLLAPQGIGVLLVSDRLNLPPFRVGGSGTDSFNHSHPAVMPDVLEAGTMNSHGVAGLSAGIDYILETGQSVIHKKSMALHDRFLAGIRGLSLVNIYGNIDSKNRVANVSLNIGSADASAVCEAFWDMAEIALRGGAHCAPLMHEALGTVSQGAVRFSFSHMNTEEEVDKAVEVLKILAKPRA